MQDKKYTWREGDKVCLRSSAYYAVTQYINADMGVFMTILVLVSLGETYGHGKKHLDNKHVLIVREKILPLPGQMYYPVDWYNQAGNGLTFDSKPESNYIFHFVGPYYPQPDEVCEGAETGDAIECSPCRIQGCANYVYTNYTFIPGEPTLPDEMYDTNCATCPSIEEIKSRKNPWASPGSAPVYGEGCGANGGNPNGCMLPEVDNRPYGSCCVYVRVQYLLILVNSFNTYKHILELSKQ